jgi:pimeloyl-ACP methyl ester carboxylesterase
MPHVKLNSLNFYYEVEGEGPPLVLIAGLSADSSSWDLIKPFLVKKFQVIRFDNRSVGRTEIPSHSYTIAEMGEDVIALLDHLGISKAHLLGHSMGGTIAQTVALQWPHYLERLIISHSFVKVAARSLFWMHHCAALYDAHQAPEETMPVVAPWIFSNNFFTDPRHMKRLIAFRKNYPYPQDPRGFRQQVEAIAAFDSRDWVNKLSLPTAIFAGEEDILTPLEGSLYLHEQIKDSQLVVQEGAHMPLMEMSRRYAKAIEQFLMK